MSEDRKFDEAAFDKAVAKPNGWSGVADPVAEIRKMRDGDEAFGKDVLSTALSLVRAHFDGAEDVFLEKSRELAARLDESGKGDLASFVRAQTGDDPSWVPMERKRQASPGNAAAMRAALESIIGNLAIHIQCGRLVAPGDHLSFAIAEAEAYIRDARSALAAPARNCDRFQTGDRLTEAVSALNAYANEEEHEPVRRWNESDWRRFLDWFFAPAKQEGGAK